MCSLTGGYQVALTRTRSYGAGSALILWLDVKKSCCNANPLVLETIKMRLSHYYGDWKKENIAPYFNKGEQGGPRELQTRQPHLCAWSGRGTDPPCADGHRDTWHPPGPHWDRYWFISSSVPQTAGSRAPSASLRVTPLRDGIRPEGPGHAPGVGLWGSTGPSARFRTWVRATPGTDPGTSRLLLSLQAG